MARSLGLTACSLGGTGTLHGRVANVLGGRTACERAATLHERAGALGAVHVRVALRVRAEVSALHERAGERDAALHGRAGALGALYVRAALPERAEAGALGEREDALHDMADAHASGSRRSSDAEWEWQI